MRKTLFLILLSIVPMLGLAQNDGPVRWSAVAAGDSVVITATTQKPWHMYDLGPYTDGPNATTIVFAMPDGVRADGPIREMDKPERKMDAIFGMKIGVYGERARFVQKFVNSTGASAKIKVTMEWQVCDAETCQAPVDFSLPFEIAPSAAAKISSATAVKEVEPLAVAVEKSAASALGLDVSKNSEGGSSIWAIIIEAVLWGFAALLTPCVFPMVPMTVSFFLKGSGSKTRGRFLASVYGISIIALYTIPIAVIIGITYFGGGQAIAADAFNWLATHWVPNVLFFLIFMTFAASFFGAFEITVPSKLVNSSDAKADKGGLTGVFFMALTLVLVSFSCTGPIVGTILVKSTQGHIWEPIVTMLAFSTAFALPFTIFALFPALLKNLPKSGGWLNSVKVVLGFLELALGLKFLSVADQTYHWGLLDREVYIALWIVIFTLLGFYLLGKLRFAHDSKSDHISVKRLFMAIITFSFVVYMIPGMWGAPLRVLSGYLPPMATIDFKLEGTSSNKSQNTLPDRKYTDLLHIPHGLQGFFDMKEGLAYAKSVNKPVFLDFTGHGCVNCREMEAKVWSDQRVQDILNRDYVIIALYVDDKKTLPETEWVTGKDGTVYQTLGKINSTYQIERFEISAQPYYCLINPFADTLLVEPKTRDLSVDNFVAFLKSGTAAFAAIGQGSL